MDVRGIKGLIIFYLMVLRKGCEIYIGLDQSLSGIKGKLFQTFLSRCNAKSPLNYFVFAIFLARSRKKMTLCKLINCHTSSSGQAKKTTPHYSNPVQCNKEENTPMSEIFHYNKKIKGFFSFKSHQHVQLSNS